jgi:hypothetical protein
MDEPLSDEAIAQRYTNHVDSLAQIERLLAEGGALSALGAERAEAEAVQHRDALRLLRLVQSARSQLATIAAEREEAYENAFEIHRERYENLRDALGERYPTAEDVVGASIAAIHRGKEQCLQLSSATSALERLRDENARLTTALVSIGNLAEHDAKWVVCSDATERLENIMTFAFEASRPSSSSGA